MAKWIRRVLFGITGERYAAATEALDTGAAEVRKLRVELQKLSETDDPFAELVHNVKSARWGEARR